MIPKYYLTGVNKARAGSRDGRLGWLGRLY